MATTRHTDTTDGRRTIEERREHPADGRRTEYPPWPNNVQEGDALRLTYDRRGEIPSHWDRVVTHTVTVIDTPMKAAGMPVLQVEGDDGLHRDGYVSIHADGTLYHRPPEHERWSVQLGRHATLERTADASG